MLVNPIRFNNLGFGSRSSVQNSAVPVTMKGELKSDTVSFGNAKAKAEVTAFEVVKGIFKGLDEMKQNAFEENTFTSFAKSAVKELGENFDKIKQIKMQIPVVEMGDGTHVKATNIFGGYVFDHALDFEKPLLNSIAIDSSSKTVEISSNFGNNGKIDTKKIKLPLSAE